jgi:triosephosphate isomerase
MIRKLVVANWKMHLNASQASLLVHRLQERIRISRDVEIVLAPSSLVLQPLSMQIDRRKFRLAAQNAYFVDEGAYTGEISFSMLHDLVHYVIIGHSERRMYFTESLEMIRDKMIACVRNDITPILCVGETQHEKRLHETKQVLHDQVTTAVTGLTAEDIENIVIAYEPVWAISTFQGELAKPTEVKQAMDYIRLQIRELYGDKAAKRVRVIYGGSVNDKTVEAYLEIEGCDGVLVGGASLNYIEFSNIVEIARSVPK